MAVGFAMMVWLNNDNGWMVISGAMVLLPLGILLFGLANWRVQVLPRWNKFPLIVGLIATLLMFLSFSGLVGMAEQQTEWLFAIYLLTLGVGWILLGVAMLLGDRETAVPKAATVSLFLLVLLLTACGGTGGNNESKVSFQNPKAGDSVSSPVHVVMQSENFTIEAAGDVHDDAGHLHIMIDTPCLAAGEVIPKDDNHRHFGDGSTEADLELASGTHTLCLQAADGAHVALGGDGMTDEISVTVPSKIVRSA
jgi:hypothetical protein